MPALDKVRKFFSGGVRFLILLLILSATNAFAAKVPLRNLPRDLAYEAWVKTRLEAMGLQNEIVVVRDDTLDGTNVCAYATVQQRVAYIAFSKKCITFLQPPVNPTAQEKGQYLSNMGGMWHEIAHHVNADVIANGSKTTMQQETDVEVWVGWAFRYSGISLSDALIYARRGAGDVTHPGPAERAEAVEKGWRIADGVLGPLPKQQHDPPPATTRGEIGNAAMAAMAIVACVLMLMVFMTYLRKPLRRAGMSAGVDSTHNINVRKPPIEENSMKYLTALLAWIRAFFGAGRNDKDLPPPPVLTMMRQAAGTAAGSPEKPDDPVADLLRKLNEDGWNVAHTTGDHTPDAARIAVGEQYVIGQFEALHRDFDTTKNRDDALLQRDVDAADDKFRRIEVVLDDARRKANEARGAVPAAEPPPTASPFIIVLGTAALGGMIALNLSEIPLIRDIVDSEIKLLVSGLFGLVVAGTSVASLYGLSPYDPNASVVRPKSVNHIASFIAGLVLIGGGFLIRFFTTGEDSGLALGFAAGETALLLYVKDNATQHRNKVAVHAERNDARVQKLKAADDAQLEVNDVEIMHGAAEEHRQQVRARFEKRLKLAFDLEKMIQSGIAIWNEGYRRGIDENRDPRGPKGGRLAA